MFDRFTDRARGTMGRARQAALRLHHDYIGTEHVLLGLVEEEDTAGGTVLRQQGIERDAIQRDVEQRVTPGTTTVTLEQLPFTARAKRVLEFSLDEAGMMEHRFIGTGHLLLGLLREGGGVGGEVLRGLGAELPAARAAVARLYADHRVVGDRAPDGTAASMTERLDDIEHLARILLDEIARLRRDLKPDTDPR